MKYILATIYLLAGIVMPFLYVNLAEAGNIQTREWILILALFASCTLAGLMWLFGNNKTAAEEKESPKPPARTTDVLRSGGKASPFKAQTQRKIVQQTVQKNAPAQAYQRPREPAVAYPTAANKPDLKILMEDVKNFIKLESWLMALQKANELIHYYPDSPEADKVRGNLNFLIQKTRENH
ncbi:MAG: hypothetical protein AB1599_10525 [Planctomycetota bacterium]